VHLCRQNGVLQDLVVVCLDEVLDHCIRLILQLSCHVGQHFRYVCQVVQADVLIADVLEHFAGQLPEFVTRRVDEVAEVAPSAPRRPVVIPARHRPVVTRLDYLVRVWRWVSSLLSLFKLIGLLEFADGFIRCLDHLVLVLKLF